MAEDSSISRQVSSQVSTQQSASLGEQSEMMMNGSVNGSVNGITEQSEKGSSSIAARAPQSTQKVLITLKLIDFDTI